MKKTLKEIASHVRVRAGYSMAFMLLIVSYTLTLYNNNQLIKQANRVSHTTKVILQLEALTSDLIDAETGVRGYLVTKDSNFLLPYKNSISVVNNTLNTLKKDIEADKIQQDYFQNLEFLINDKYEKIHNTISIYNLNNVSLNDSIFKSLYASKLSMERTKALIKKMQAHEQTLLLERQKDLNKKYTASTIIIITSLLITLMIGIFGFYTYMKEYKARLIADKKISQTKEELQRRVAELDTANKDLVVMKRSEKFASTGRIARTIAHEVRNPLTNIDLAVSQIKSELSDKDSNTFMLFDMVKRNSDRINQLISELLNATRFIEVNAVSTSVNTLLDEALKLANDRIKLKHIKIEKRYSSDICSISVDTEKIKIAFLNLMVNAIEAMNPYEGLLKIETRGEENKCVVEITDNGSGMTEEQLSKVFEPYFTTKANGNGLGLANTANIILSHQGDINVVSTPGSGTTFTIKFNFSESNV